MGKVFNQSFIIMDDRNDVVATALKHLTAGETLTLEFNKHETIIIQDDIPFGHKFAITNLSKGSSVYKYGQVIGRATCYISSGQHVHVHNLESLRGRGDLSQAGVQHE